jgi:broad specificity phosphatase PhoE
MKTLDVLRHAMREKPGTSLSKEGRDLARHVGATLSAYALVVTSTLPRAIQTAEAMGFAVTGTEERLGLLDDGIARKIWPGDLGTVDRIVAADPECTQAAQAQASLWQDIAARLSDGQAGLIITHGGILELGVVASLRRARQPIDGEAFAYCEGVRLSFGDHGCERVAPLRLPAERRLISN